MFTKWKKSDIGEVENVEFLNKTTYHVHELEKG